MMPPVSLPLNGGTVSARAGANASIPLTADNATKAPIIRIADSICFHHLKAHPRPWKERRAPGRGVISRCCRVALDFVSASRHRPRLEIIRRIAHARPRHVSEKARPPHRPCCGPRYSGSAGVGADRRGGEPVRNELLAVRSEI